MGTEKNSPVKVTSLMLENIAGNNKDDNNKFTAQEESSEEPAGPVQVAEQPAETSGEPEPPRTLLQKVGFLAREGALLTFQVLVIFLVIINFIGRVSIVQGSSMNPVLQSDNRVLINLLSYRFGIPHRGDVIVFQCPASKSKDYIKRIVALPGETVEIKKGTVYINGKELQEPYLQFVDKFECVRRTKIPENHVYVLGDNRINSEDSRVWGPVAYKLIKGKADVVFWPVQSITLLK